MKKSLRLFTLLSLLFATIAGYAITVPTLTEVWKHTTGLPKNGNARQGAMYGGKMYILNRVDNEIKVWDETGMVETIKTTGGGAGINFDEVGNMVVRSENFSGNAVSKSYTIYSKSDNYVTTKKLTITNVEGRADYIGKIAGDILSNGGGHMCCAVATVNNFYDHYIVNGVEDEKQKKTFTSTIVNDATTIVYPFGKYYILHNRGNATILQLDELGNKTELKTPDKGTTCGSDVFILNGTTYVVYGTDKKDYKDGFSIADQTSGKVVASHNGIGTIRPTSATANWLYVEKVSDFKVNIFQYNPENIIAKYTFEVPNPYVAPTAFTLTSKVSTKAGEKNIFLGFDATWTAPAALDGYTISYKLTHSAGSVDIPAGTTTTTLYGANAGDISLQAVYTSNSVPNLIYFSEIVKAPYIPINVLEPANITEIKDKKRYDIDGVYTATLNWAVTTTNPIAHYLVKYADATKAGAITYKEFYGAERNYPFTGLQNMTVGQDKTTSQADGSMSKLAENPTGVIVNYLIVPGYRIGNTIKQKIVDADYSDATIATVNYPTALTGMKSTTFTEDMPTLTGVEGIEVGKVAIYPNPTTGQVTIALNSEISTVAVYSLSGALVRNIDGNGEVTMPCDFSDLASGVYFVKVNNCNPTKVIIK